MEVLAIFGFVLAGFCYLRIEALENKLKETGALDKRFNSKDIRPNNY